MKNLLMRKLLFLYSSIPLFLILAVLPLNAEYLFLKDGSIIKGKIITETADLVTLRNEQKNVVVYPHNKVLRVLYSEISMGKVYVQMKNGKNFRGYMVDEEQESYTFRYIIDKPEEFKVKRTDVLFMAERNPSGLNGESGYTDITLNWFLPYDKMKYFNIYLKKEKNDKFKIIDTSRTNSYQLNNLKNYTKYSIKVTGVDDTGTETLPSNEITIITCVRVDVQLKDGKIFKTSLVAEDKDRYTFRDDIKKSKDYNIKRADVLFITERYPTGLKGESSYTDITLNWFHPYDKMKYFNIYYKKNIEDKYILSGTAGSNSYKLKDLKGNTKYYFKVTGVDYIGNETTSSNEIIVTTLNQPPTMPAGLKVTQQKTGEAVLEWKPSVDPDGTIIKYKIYTLKKNKKELAGETKDTSFKISGAAVIDRVQVSAIDDMGAESNTAGIRVNQEDVFSIYITPSVILPLGMFGAMGDVGYGGTASFMAQNLFTKGFTLGLELGYYYIPGKNALGFSGQNIHLINLVTGAIKTGYAYKYNNFLIITPTISIGAAYMDLTYTARDYQTLVTYTEKSARGFDPMGAVSLSFDFIISNHFLIGLNASYGLIFEAKNVFQYLTFGLNIGARF